MGKQKSYQEQIAERKYPEERWAYIEGFNNKYQISSYGRVASLTSQGPKKKAKKKRMLSLLGDISTPLDFRVSLKLPDGGVKQFQISTLVNQYFPDVYVKNGFMPVKEKALCIVYSYDVVKHTIRYFKTVKEFCEEYHISQERAYDLLTGRTGPWLNQKLYYTDNYNSFRTKIRDFDFLQKKNRNY